MRDARADEREAPQTWRYTTTKPADGWDEAEFDDSGWKTGPGGFGDRRHARRRRPHRVEDARHLAAPHVRARRVAETTASSCSTSTTTRTPRSISTASWCASLKGYTTAATSWCCWTKTPAKLLRAGRNTIAVHCHQTGGGQYIDVGLMEIVESGSGTR